MIPWDLWYTYVYILVGFDIFIIIFVIWFEWYRKRGKIKIRVKTPIGEREEWKKPKKDGKTVVMEKARGKKAGWKFTFSRKSLYFTKRFPGRRILTLDIIANSLKAIEYDFKKLIIYPYGLTLEDMKNINRADILKQRGQGLKLQLPTIFWLVLLLCGINLVMGLAILSKLGAI